MSSGKALKLIQRLRQAIGGVIGHAALLRSIRADILDRRFEFLDRGAYFVARVNPARGSPKRAHKKRRDPKYQSGFGQGERSGSSWALA
jgi:hypothetical protein